MSKSLILFIIFCFLLQIGENGFPVSSNEMASDFLELVDAEIEEEKKEKLNSENLFEQNSDKKEFFDRLIHIENYLFPYLPDFGNPLDLPPKLLTFL